jgi:phage gpG-like protein
MARDRFKFDLVIKELKGKDHTMKREIAVETKNYFVQSFKDQKFYNKKWKEVQRRIPGTKAYKYPKKKGLKRRTRPILIGKGTLRRAVNGCIKTVGSKITFQIDLPYAAIHNEGLKMKNGKAMPKRQFMGQNKTTDNIAKTIIKKYVNKAFRR